MITLAFDPGPTKCGVAAFCHDTRRVTLTWNGASVEECLELLATSGEFDQVAIERVQSYGISGSSLLRTSEVVGRLWQAALAKGAPVHLIYRREVLSELDVSGRGSRDAQVRQRLLEMFGGRPGE